MDFTPIADLAASQLGIVTFEQLDSLGLTKRQVVRRVDDGLLERVHVGVFRIRAVPESYEQRLVAAYLAIGPEAAASHRAAATVHGLLRYRTPPIEVTTTRLRSPEVAGVVVHRLADLHDRWTAIVDGVRVTTVARTIVDLGAVASVRTVEAALDRAAGRRLVTFREVRDAMVAVARKGRRGVGTVRPLLTARIGEGLPAGVFSARLATLLREAGLPPAVPEFVVRDEHGGFIAAVDFAFPDQRLAIEADGYEFHSSVQALADRNVRDRLLARADWLTLHFSWDEVDRQLPRVEDDIRDQLRRRTGLRHVR